MGNPWAYDLTAIGARAAPLLFVLGSDADPGIKKEGGFRVTGNSDIYKLLPESVPFEQVNLSKPFMRKNARPALSRHERVFNLVTDPDQHPQTLTLLGKLLRGFRGKVINRPEAVLRTTRDQVAKRLEGIEGLRVPKVLRLRNPSPGSASAAAQRAGLAFPLIVRMAGTHTGTIIGIFNRPDELDAAVGGPGAFILTEFVDFRSDDGIYRKYRAFFIGRRRIFRHLISSDGWSIHAKERFDFMAKYPALIAEEQDILKDPAGLLPEPASAALDAVRERLGLDYFGIDFGIVSDGRAVMFEANATMNFFPVVDLDPFAHIQCVIEPARQALMELLGSSASESLAR